MTIPTITFEISFDDVSDTTPAWTDVTAYAASWSATRGRNHELQRIDAGTATLMLENPDGRFTPGNAASPYYPNVVPRRRLRITAVFSSTTYRLFHGYIESWKVSPSGDPERWSDVQVTAVDAFKILSGTDLFAAYAEAISVDTPAAYLPLTEGPGSTTAGVRFGGGSTPTVPLLRSKNGSAASDFGGEKVIRYGDTGTSLNLNPASTSVRADILDCSYIDQAYAPNLTGWTFEGWFNYSQIPGNTHYLLRHQSKHGTGINGFAISIHTDGKVYVSTGSETDVIATASSIVDMLPHHIALVYTSTGTFGHALLYLDGALVSDYTLTAGIYPFGEQAAFANTIACVGGVRYATLVQDGGMRALLAHVAFYSAALTGTQILNHYNAGALGSPEDETTRIGLVLDLAGWPSADRSLEAGLANTLQPRDWSDPSPTLNVVGDAAVAAGGILFMSGDNKVTYQNRAHRYNRAVAATFGASNDAPEVTGAVFAADDTEIRNDLDVSRAGQGITNLTDSASISKYGSIKYSVDLAITGGDEVISAAQWALYLYADPAPRVPALTWSPSTNANTLFPKLLPLEIGDRITVTNLPATVPDGPVDVFVEQVTHGSGSSGQEWLTTLQLSPASKYDVSTVDTGKVETGTPLLIVAY
jgi:hypothetical protein